MNRRKYMYSLIVGSMAGLAGCSGSQSGGTQTTSQSGGTQTTSQSGGTQTTSQSGGTQINSGINTTISNDSQKINTGPESGAEYKQVRDIKFWSMPRSNQADLFQIGRLAAKNLSKLGLTIDFQVKAQSQRVSDVFGGKFDMAQLKWSALPTNAIPYYNLYSSFHSDSIGTTNIPHFNNKEFDKAVDEFKSSYDKKKRINAAQKAQKILSEQTPVDFCIVPESRVAANTSSFTNWKAQVGGFSYSNINTFRDLKSTGNKDTLIYGTSVPLRGFPNFMALAASPVTWILYKFMYDSLIELDYDGSPYGRAAKDWEVKDDKKTIVFKLRQDMTWQDGDTVTAEDVKFTWDYITEYNVGWLSSDYAPYKSSEVVDKHTIRFHLKNPSAIFIPISCYRMPILPKHIWENVVQNNDIKEPAKWTTPDYTGSGPLQLKQYKSKNQVVFDKFSDHYWAEEIPFDQFIEKIYGSQTPALNDLKKDKIQFVQSVLVAQFEKLKNTSQLKTYAAPNFTVSAIFYRNDIQPYDNLALRKAIAYATNKQDMINIVYNGNATQSPTCVAPAAKPYYNSNAEKYEFNVTKARQILKNAGYRWDKNDNLLKPLKRSTAGTPPV